MLKNKDKIFENNNFSENKFSRSVFQTLAMAYKPFAGRIITVLILGLLGRALLLSSSNVIGIWVDRYCQKPLICRPVPFYFQDLTPENFILILSVMTVLGFIMTLFFRTLFSRLSAQAVSKIYDEVTWRTSRYPISFFDRTPAGRIITRFSSDYGNVFRLFGGPLAEFLAIVFDLIMMLILMGVASPYFLIFVAVIVIINYLVYRLNRDQLRMSRRLLSSSRSPSIAHFAETAQGASTIRTFSKESSFSNRFADLDFFYLNHRMTTVTKLITFSFQMNSLTAFLFLITGLGSIALVEKGLVSIGSLGVAFGLIILSGNTIQMFFEWLAQFEEAMIGVERLDEYLRKPLELGNYLPSKAQFLTNHPQQIESYISPWLGQNQASVEFKNVYFRYHEMQPWIIEDLSFKINPGEHLGIIGSTGSGKSTLIQLLFHLYPIQKGEIKINDLTLDLQNPKKLGQLDSLRSAISYISQDPTLFQGTLRENLDMTLSKSDSEVEDALNQVGLKNWPHSMLIEERGKNLSSGERQLVCMARCLLQKSPIVIMDEATSFVDPQSEEIMVQATNNYFNKKTQILIAHRLTTLKNCDRILWLDHGRVRELGPTTEVLRKLEASQMFDV